MKKRKISIFDCMAGDVLAHDIIADNGVKMLVKDTVINPYIQEKLIEIGVREVFVYEYEDGPPFFASLQKNPKQSEFHRQYGASHSDLKEIITSLAAGNKLDVEQLSQVSTFVHSKIQETELVVQSLCTLQNIDEHTYAHSLNTAFYAMLTGKWLKLSSGEIEKLIQSALLHDIGKVRIPAHILNKQTILTREEYEEIKKHTVFGYEMLSGTDQLDEDVKRVALLHHERIDCSGYPYQAGPHFINIYARIVAVADVYDAMITPRPYKDSLTPFAAFELFSTVGMKMFDPLVLLTFLKNIVTYYVGAEVLFNTGEKGKILYIPPHDTASPVVRTKAGIIDLAREKNIRIVKML
ncbi:MAG TPA: HD-GYP domain-containing protein [Firmicutes bacterium]|nr:HD-GYP domain-containing protein [Bacillota bacterium]